LLPILAAMVAIGEFGVFPATAAPRGVRRPCDCPVAESLAALLFA